MADFGVLIPTAQGVKAQLKVQSGETITFSKIKMGDGTFTGNISNLTDLVSTKVTLDITEKYIKNDIFVVDSFFSNEDLSQGFYWKEIGLYIREGSKDVLYAYAYAGSNYDYIPATTDTRYAKHIKVGTAVKSSANITIVEGESMVYVDKVSFDNKIAEFEQRFDTIELGYVKTSEIIETVIYASKWTSDNRYTISNNKILRATQPIEMLPGKSITAEQLTTIQIANLVEHSQAVGSVTFKAMGEKPTIDIPVKLIVRGDM